jgi:hypothetical protein
MGTRIKDDGIISANFVGRKRMKKRFLQENKQAMASFQQILFGRKRKNNSDFPAAASFLTVQVVNFLPATVFCHNRQYVRIFNRISHLQG